MFDTAMSNKSALGKIIFFSRVSVLLSCCWPPSPTATKIQLISFKIIRIWTIISAILLYLPLCYAVYVHYDDTLIFVKSVIMANATSQIIVQTLYSATQQNRLQRLIEEMKMFFKIAKPEETDVLLEYSNRCCTFYVGCIIWFYGSASFVALGTLLIPQPFPTDAVYPFPVDYFPLRCIIFLHQWFILLQCAAHVCVNCFGALLLWFSAARFDILMREVHTVTNVPALILCLKKYQKIKRYTKEVAFVVRIIVLIATFITTGGLIFCPLVLFSEQPITVKIQFLSLIAIGFLEVFMCAWPADHLIDMSLALAQSVYESAWYMQDVHFQKQILYIMSPQRPITVSIHCIMPVLSLRYYSSFVANAFSVFTALRVVLLDDDES